MHCTSTHCKDNESQCCQCRSQSIFNQLQGFGLGS